MTNRKQEQPECFAGFVPCRDEKCPLEEVHEQGSCGERKYQKHRVTKCPDCSAPVINLPHMRAACTKCIWRGSRKLPITFKKAKTNA